MKIVNNNSATIERIGTGVDQAFQINFDAKMARILADGLYSDKVQSVIRELSCNAYDSHVMAGCPERPIEVHFPNRMEPWFSVGDNGVGLSHTDVMNIYTTYGASTKTMSNDVIGQLGLGSKSPFALTEAFTVDTVKDGIANHYSMYRNEQGMPSVNHLGAHRTTEPNGVTVKVPVSKDLRNEFIEKAKNVYKWFPVKPTVVNENVYYPPVDLVHYGTGWSIRSTEQRRSYGYHHVEKPVAVMGMVAYPIATGSIKGLSEGAKHLLETPVVLYFDIGELEVAANREALGYDERTCANIVAKMNQMVIELGKMFEQQISGAKSLWEAKKKFGEIFDKGHYAYEFGRAYQHLGLRWNGQVINSNSINVDFGDIYPKVNCGTADVVQTDVYESNWRYKRPRKLAVPSISMECESKVVVMFNDLKIGGMSRVMEFAKAKDNKLQIWIFNSSSLATWDDILAKLGNPDVMFTSSLPAPARKAAVRTGMLKYNGLGYGGKKAWTPVEIDLNIGGFYVELDGWDVKMGDFVSNELSWWKRNAIDAGLIPANTEIYAMRNKHKKMVKEHDDWHDFFDVVKSQLAAEIASRNISQEIVNAEEFSRLTTHAKINFWGIVSAATRFKDPTSPVLRFIETVQLYNTRTSKLESLRAMANRCRIELATATAQHNLVAMYDSLMMRYPMLAFVAKKYSYSYDSITSDDWSTIVCYINYVDATATFYNLQEHEVHA